MPVAFPGGDLRAELRHLAGRRGEGLQLTAFLERPAQRLFGVQVQSAPQNLRHDLAMRVVGRCHKRRIQLLTLEHFTPVLVEPGLGVLRAQLVEHSQVHVAERGHLDAAVRRDRPDVRTALRSASDAS